MTRSTLDPKHLLDDIFNLNISDCYITICLASFQKDSTVPQFEQLDIEESLTTTFRSIINFNLEQRKRDADLRVVQYAFDTKPEAYEIEYLQLNEEPYDIIKGQIEEVSQSTLSIPTFEQDEKFLKRVRFYVIVAQPRTAPGGEQQVCFYRIYTQMKRLKQSFFAVLSDKGYYNRVEAEKIFLFDDEIDCVSQGDTLFVFNKDKFHSMFNFYEELKKIVDRSLSTIKVHVPIGNFDEFEAACKNDTRKIAKLRSIEKKAYLTSLKGNMEKIVQFNTERNLGLRIENGMFVYEAKTHWRLLKLLDDDFLLSELTERRYNANSKREL